LGRAGICVILFVRRPGLLEFFGTEAPAGGSHHVFLTREIALADHAAAHAASQAAAVVASHAAAVAAADGLADRLAELAEHTPPDSALAAEITAVLAALR